MDNGYLGSLSYLDAWLKRKEISKLSLFNLDLLWNWIAINISRDGELLFLLIKWYPKDVK